MTENKQTPVVGDICVDKKGGIVRVTRILDADETNHCDVMVTKLMTRNYTVHPTSIPSGMLIVLSELTVISHEDFQQMWADRYGLLVDALTAVSEAFDI